MQLLHDLGPPLPVSTHVFSEDEVFSSRCMQSNLVFHKDALCRRCSFQCSRHSDALKGLQELLPQIKHPDMINELLYADDTLVISLDDARIQGYMKCIVQAGANYGLLFNWRGLDVLPIGCDAFIFFFLADFCDCTCFWSPNPTPPSSSLFLQLRSQHGCFVTCHDAEIFSCSSVWTTHALAQDCNFAFG